jgi:hypothetical protein
MNRDYSALGTRRQALQQNIPQIQDHIRPIYQQAYNTIIASGESDCQWRCVTGRHTFIILLANARDSVAVCAARFAWQTGFSALAVGTGGARLAGAVHQRGARFACKLNEELCVARGQSDM